MKILFIAPRYHLNLYYRIKALLEAKHSVSLLVLYKQPSERYDILEPIEIKKSFFNKFFKKQGDFWKIKMQTPSIIDLFKKIKQINPDIVIIKNLQTVLSLFSLVIARIFKKRIFILIQTDNHFVKNKIKKFIILVLKNIFKVEGIITPLKNNSAKHDDFFKYIPFVFEVKDFEKKYFKDDKINILDIGKFYQRKDHLLLLKAINNLKNKYNIRLTIAGETGEEAVKKEILGYIEKNKLSDIVSVKENLPHQTVLDLYREQDLFVLPSYDEPAAYSIVEAMAAKLPIIASDTCGTSCYIEGGKNGYIFKSHDEKSLEEKIEKIIKDRDNLKSMGEKAFLIAKSDHSSDIFEKRFAELIKNNE